MTIKSFRLILVAFAIFTLTACGGGGGGSSAAAGSVPLTTAQITLAQAVVDIVTTALDSSVAFIGTTLDDLQAEFDNFATNLVGTGVGGIITALEIQAVQDALDVFTTTTDGSAGALTAAQIQLAQDALDSFLP